MRPTIGKHQILHNMSIDVTFGACRSWGVCLICCGVQATFYHTLYTKSPTAPIWNNFNGVKYFLEKNNKNERKWLSGWCLMKI